MAAHENQPADWFSVLWLAPHPVLCSWLWPNQSATALRENTPPGYFLIPQGSLEGGRKARNGQPTVFHPLRPRFPLSSELLCTADRVGKYELRTAGAYCPALPVVLGLRCECELYGTAASQVKVLCSQGAQHGNMVCFYGAHLRALAFIAISSRILSQNENIYKIKAYFSNMRIELSSRPASVTLRK